MFRPNRRTFVQGIATGALTLAGGWPVRGLAQSPAYRELSGREFDLDIAPGSVNFTGRPTIATIVNGGLPGPTLRWREGDNVTIRVTNRLRETSSIHWHGLLLPYAMDGGA
jgi:FtsP/CotA-like multicopper oxidase with cupredoxin domain